MNKRKIYIYSNTDYENKDEYIDYFENKKIDFIKGDISVLQNLIQENDHMQLDTETNMTDFYTERELYVIQLGDLKGEKQLIIDYPSLKAGDPIIKILSDLFKSDMTFYAHNAKFEYKVIYKHFNIYIKNFKDSLLASKVMTSGISFPGQNSLAGVLDAYFNIKLDKDEQTTFNGEVLTPQQIFYAAEDVVSLYRVYTAILSDIKRNKLGKVLGLENKTLRPLGDMEINGFLIDTKALDENIIDFETTANGHENNIIELLENSLTDEENNAILELGIIQKEDEFIINWNSSTQKKLILNLLYPALNIKSSAKNTLLKAIKENENTKFIQKIIDDEVEEIEIFLLSRHEEFLRENDMFRKKGAININLKSPSQLLKFFKIFYPNLTGVGVKALKKLRHPIIMEYKKLAKASKMVSSFGQKMHAYIEDDGKIHTTFNQLVPSGSRLSSRSPNIQQAPSTEEFRRIYIPDPGWVLVDSDYSSMEMVIAAHLAQDKKLLHAINNGYDLHSYSAYQIFGDEWIEAGGSPTPKGKPSTKEGGVMRKKSKGLSFSLLYGTGPQAFGDNAGISMADAKALMKKYYETFPELAAFFKKVGADALRNYKVREPIFGRVRFFHRPTNGMEFSHLKNAAMNYNPQAINGSVMKYALCLMKAYIEKYDLDDKVKLLLTVHDQSVSMAREDFAEEWAEKQTELMEKAANYAVPGNVIKAESDILKHWTKG